MPLTVAVQMDPIERIRIAGDSTFALLLEAQARGHTPALLHARPAATCRGRGCSRRRSRSPCATSRASTRRSAKRARSSLRELDVVLLRQDPPFDLAYIATTHLLERIHPRTLVVNDPARGARRAGKAVRDGLPRADAADAGLARARRDRGVPRRAWRSGDEAALRLWRRLGVQARVRDPNFGSLFDLFSTTFREPWVIQKFLPAVVRGDKRIMLVDGEPLGAVNRVPAEDDIRSNMVRGGAAKETELTQARARDLRRIGPELKRRGLIFTGIDVIDGWLTEINVTSPTGIAPSGGSAGPISRRRSGTSSRPSGAPSPRRRAEPGMSTPTPSVSARRARARAIPARLFDRARIEARLAKLRKETAGDDAAFRQGAVEAFRDSARIGRERSATRAGGRGRRASLRPPAQRARGRADLRHSRSDGACPLSERRQRRGRITIVAVGGYGRGMLAPGSDIDLLFLSNPRAARNVKIIETILYVLWDLKQKVGHATRSIDECIKQARADLTIRTADARSAPDHGRRKQFATLRARFDKEIVAKTASEFVAAKLAERDARINRAGASRYLVEPNVKDGKGGLRDLNTLFWIAKYVYRVDDPHELVAAGLFSQREFALFSRCEEFLWSVRCHLHFLTGHAEERLSFDVQRPIAERLGYAARAGQEDVERFMKHYFLVAKESAI